MNSLIKGSIIVLHIALTLIVTSCSESQEQKADAVELPADSIQLRIAVMPTLDCLPVYLAAEHGFFDREGINVILCAYNAQMDCDTAFENRKANALMTDVVRAEQMKENGEDIQYVTATNLSWQLLSPANLHIMHPRQLDDKMMAMTRFSATHYISDLIVTQAHLKPERVYLVQINDVNVRLRMFRNGLMDALLLPEPQATNARNAGASVLYDTEQTDLQLGVIVFRKSAATTRQTEAFKKAYNEACDSINEHGFSKYADLIKTRCGVDQTTVDSLPEVKFRHVAQPNATEVKRVNDWLKQQKRSNNVQVQNDNEK